MLQNKQYTFIYRVSAGTFKIATAEHLATGELGPFQWEDMPYDPKFNRS